MKLYIVRVPRPVKQELQKWRFTEEIHKRWCDKQGFNEIFFKLLLHYSYWV